MTWTVESTTDSTWIEATSTPPDGVCIAGLLIPGEAIAGVGYGFWPVEDSAATTVWSE